MAKWETGVHQDVFISADGLSVHRTTGAGWHGVVGLPILRGGVHVFQVEITRSFSWVLGVVDCEMHFNASKTGWHAMGMMYDGTTGVSPDGASALHSTGGRCLAVGDIEKVEMKVDLVSRRLSFRRPGDAEWKEALSQALVPLQLPPVVRPWALLGTANKEVKLVAYKVVSSNEKTVDETKLFANLADDISSLQGSEETSDVTIILGDVRIPAHVAVLVARSKFFAAMLRSPMKEALSREIELQDTDATSLQELLGFLYSGKVSQKCLEDPTATVALLKAANRFEVPLLEELCATRAAGNLQVASVAEVLQAADSINCSCLKEACLAFATEHLEEVMSTSGFRRLAEARPPVVLDLLALIAPRVKRPRHSTAWGSSDS